MDTHWLLRAGLAALVVLPLALAAAWRLRTLRRAQRRARRTAPLRYPVVLAHGLMGFDQLRLAGKTHDYFRGVPLRLRSTGAEVHSVRLAPVGGVQARAEQLARMVRALDARKVNIIAHSMGGLDARYAISRLGLAAKVASLTTIGTPHRGTPVADLGTTLVGDKLGLKRALGALGLELDAFYDLTTTKMEGFNRDVEDARGVAYASFTASLRGKVRRMNPLLIPSYMYLAEAAGPNDGLVPAASQRWGELLGEIDADHWAQIGWSRGFDAPGFYAQLLRELRGRGF